MYSNSMGKINKIFLLLFYIFLSIDPIFGLYEDQVGKFEWIKQYVGQVEHIVFDQSSSPSRRVLVSTGQNVLAALSTKSGDILWRHLLEPTDIGKIEVLSANEHFVSTITGNLLRTWDMITAALKKEVVLDSLPTWSQTLNHWFEFGSNSEDLFLVALSSGKLSLYIYDSTSGEIVNQKSIDAAWANQNTKCSIGGDVLLCLDALGGQLHSLLLTSNQKMFSSKPLSSFGTTELMIQQAAADPALTSVTKVSGSKEYFLVKVLQFKAIDNTLTVPTNIGDLFILESVGSIKKVFHSDKGGVHVTKDVSGAQTVFVDKETLFVVSQQWRTVTIEAFDIVTGKAIEDQGIVADISSHNGMVQTVAIQQFPRRDGTMTIRALISCSDHSVHLIRNGGVVWSREEALSRILKVEAIDLPVEGAETTYQDQLSYEPGLFSSLIHRFKSHSGQIVGLFNAVFRSKKDADLSPKTLIRDQFNMRKLMVAVTSSGKILAIDNVSEDIVWSVFVPMLSSFKNGQILLFTQRSSAHFPLIPQCVIAGKHKETGEGLLYVFNPLTGEGIGPGGGVISLGYSLLQTSLLQQTTDDFIKPLLLIDTDFKPHVFPTTAEDIVLRAKNSLYVHLATHGASMLKGYSLRDSKPGAFHLSEVWSLSLGTGVEITGIYGKRTSEKLHSAGRVLADRSVLYKYANPNLAVVTTFGQDTTSKNTLVVHLIDMVTGTILESVTHKRVTGPFHVVHSENWVVYTSYNEKFRRHEVTTLDLFEGLEQSNATVFSSFGSKATPPIVERQTFILPQGVQATSHTTTEKGITTKFILFALETGNILQMSKWYLDPRRPMTPQGPREEGLVPYMPELPMPHQEMINHNKTLPRVSAIYTSPSGLESACLVFVYGLDVFYTRIFPSKMFDVLNDDFDHSLIVVALVSLTTAAIISRKLSQRKALKQAWK